MAASTFGCQSVAGLLYPSPLQGVSYLILIGILTFSECLSRTTAGANTSPFSFQEFEREEEEEEAAFELMRMKVVGRC